MSDEQRDLEDSKESQDGLTDDTFVPKPAPKRRASRAGTRSVASLTPDQLARKRANDREAQRSIRQRTKNHIEELERRIQDLSAEHDEKNIEELQRRNEELEEELRQLKEILSRPDSNMGSSASSASSPDLTPLSSRYGMEVLGQSPTYQYTPQWSTQNTFSVSSGTYSPYPTSSAGDLLSSLVPDYSGLNAGYSNPSTSSVETFNAGVSLADVTAPLPSIVSSNSARNRGPGYGSRPNFGRSRSYPNGRLGQSAYQSSFPTLASARTHGAINSTSGPSITSHPVPPIMNPSMMSGISQPAMTGHPISPAMGPSGLKINIDVMGTLPASSQPMSSDLDPAMMSGNSMMSGSVGMGNAKMPMQADAVTYDLPNREVEQPSLQSWEIPLRFVAPTGPVDSIFVSLLQRRRQIALEGTSGIALIGPASPSLKALVNPEQSNNVHPVASVISNLLQRTSLRSLPEKIAAMLIIYSLVQWQISPTEETYNNIPEWFTPRASQQFTAHPFWATMIAFPKLKDIVIGNQSRYATDEFQHTYTASLNLNWPYRELDALTFEGDEVRASDAFIQHVRNLGNWSLDEPFQRAYPELRDACKFTEFHLPIMNGNA